MHLAKNTPGENRLDSGWTLSTYRKENPVKSYGLPSVFHGVTLIFVGHGLFKCFFFVTFYFLPFLGATSKWRDFRIIP